MDPSENSFELATRQVMAEIKVGATLQRMRLYLRAYPTYDCPTAEPRMPDRLLDEDRPRRNG